MVVHILIDIAQEETSNDTHRAKRNRREIHPAVALGVGDLTCLHDDRVRGLVVGDSRDELELFEQGGAGQGDRGLDGFGGGDVEVFDHGAADVVDRIGDEFVVEDVVVDGVAYAAADDADGECEGCDCCYEILGDVSRGLSELL